MNNKLKEAIAVVDEVLNDPIIGCDVTVMQEQALRTLISLAKASLEVELPEEMTEERDNPSYDACMGSHITGYNQALDECRPILAGYRAREKALKQQFAEMEEAKCRYQKSLGKVTKELWDTKTKLTNIKGRAGVEEIETTLFHHVGIEIAEERSIDLHDSKNRERLATAISKHILEGK